MHWEGGRNGGAPVRVRGFPDSSVGEEPAWMQETLVQFLGHRDLLEKG